MPKFLIAILIILAGFFIVLILVFAISYFSQLDLINFQESEQESVNKSPVTNNDTKMPDKKIQLITVYDNYLINPDLETGHGFSCYVEIPNANILFDTGADSQTLLSNLQKLNLDPKKVSIVVLSHIHGDHIGGLAGFLKINNQVKIYLPSSFPDSVKQGFQANSEQVIEVSDPVEISDNAYSTGELGITIIEQGLVIKTNQGNILITGCAHPGIVQMAKKTKELYGNIYLVIGGFHLGSESDEKIMSIINELKELGVEKAAPCHCSGDRARELFKQEFGNDYIENGVGKIIEIN